MKTKIRVVLADDHPVVRDGLAAMVNQQADMEVVAEAGDGEEAITLYEQHRPDVMVLDLASGKLLEEFDAGSAITASPALAGGRLVVGTTDGAVLCFASPA